MKSFLLVLSVFVFCSFGFAEISDDSWTKLTKYYYLNKNNTSDAQTRFNLAMAYAYTGFVEEGFKEIASIPLLDPEFKYRALERYSRKVKSYPKNWEYRFFYAFILFINEKKDEAIEEFRKVVDLVSDDSIKGWAYGYMAYIYADKREWEKAMETINIAIKYEPEGAGLYFAQGLARKEKGDNFGAASAIIKASTLQAKQMLNRKSLKNLKND